MSASYRSADGLNETPVSAATPLPGYSPGGILTTSNTLTRVSDTNAYAIADLIGASTSAGNAGNYTAISSVARGSGEAVSVRRVRLRSNQAARQGAVIVVHLFRGAPTLTVGDNGQFNNAGVLASDIAKHVGEFQCSLDRAGSDGAKGMGVPALGSEVTVAPDDGSTLYAVLETKTAFTPTSGEVFTITLECARS